MKSRNKKPIKNVEEQDLPSKWRRKHFKFFFLFLEVANDISHKFFPSAKKYVIQYRIVQLNSPFVFTHHRSVLQNKSDNTLLESSNSRFLVVVDMHEISFSFES